MPTLTPTVVNSGSLVYTAFERVLSAELSTFGAEYPEIDANLRGGFAVRSEHTGRVVFFAFAEDVSVHGEWAYTDFRPVASEGLGNITVRLFND